MLINLEFDQNALSAPQSFRDTIQGAANLIDSTFTDPITVNLSVGYGELTAGSTTYTLTNGAAESEALGGGLFGYSQVRGLLAGQVSADVSSGVQALPDAAAVQGQSNVVVWSAEQKALGLVAADGAGLDGASGFATDIPINLLQGVALHELTHAMGRVSAQGSQADVLDLYRFSSPGVHLFGQASAPSYFSLDGGTSDLGDYGLDSDPSDFLNSSSLTPNDAFNEYYGAATLQQLSPVDLLQMEALGFHAATGAGADPVVYTADASYAAPAGVTTIYLEGSSQAIYANAAGDIIISNDTGNYLFGGAGNDTFNLGRGGDWAAGNGGADTFRFAGIPWAGGHITDFGPGDVLDLSGLMSTTSDTGADGFADGYLAITDDGQGDAQVWAQYAPTGAAGSGWWLVVTLDGVSPTGLQHSGDLIGLGSSAGTGAAVTTGPTDVSTSDASYTAAASVKTITLTGSQQYIDASATSGVTIASNDSGNVLIGGSGDDVFHLGRGGDWVAGGAGADTFVYSGTPWAGGGITDFNGAEGDRIDVSGLLQASGYTGSDPFADGFLKLTADGSGNAQLWSDFNQPNDAGWWLVATLDGVATSSLHYSGGMIT